MKVYITTPIYYVTDAPHIGHAYTSVNADVLARAHRLRGDEVWFLTGTDEHGLKVARAAEQRGVSPLEWANTTAQRYRDVWDHLELSHDDFIRTTEARHRVGVQKLLQAAYDAGDVYAATYEGEYCVSCEAYYEPEELGEGGTCPVHERPVEHVIEDNWFFRLSAYEDRLLAWLDENPDAVKPAIRRNEVLGFIRGGLKDFSISRRTLTWGIPLPWDPDQVAYVWSDALTNYATAIGYGTDESRFSHWWPADYHFVGKDILRFHAVYWPALLLAAGLAPPRTVLAHGWIVVGGQKMSKTLANQIHPRQITDVFGVDAFRYYWTRIGRLGPDLSFSWEDFARRYEADLANAWGNLVSRVLHMVERYRDGAAPARGPAASGEAAALDADLGGAAAGALAALQRGIDEVDIAGALEETWRFLGRANAYVEGCEPWKLAKDPGAAGRLDTVLNALLESLRVSAVLVSPVVPGAAERVWAQLGLPGSAAAGPLGVSGRFGEFTPGTRVRRGGVLFPKVEVEASA